MVRDPVLEVMLLDNNEPTSYGEAMVGSDYNEWLEAINPREDPCMTTKYRLWKNYSMVVRLLSTDGY